MTGESCAIPTKNSEEYKEDGDFIKFMKRIFGIDTRALAVFRILMGVFIIIDLIVRAQALTAHYTDAGVLPRSTFITQFMNSNHFSFHLLNGQSEYQLLLFLISGFFAFLLIIGYRTRIATIVSWVLLISLHNRNPMVLNGGDALFRMLLFWSIFLPLGVNYSIDRALNSSKKIINREVLSIATVAILIQVAIVYIFSALLKTDPIWYPEASATYYALSIDQFTTKIGYILLGFTSLLPILTISVLALEALGPILVFIPTPKNLLRIVITISFMLMHLGFAISLKVGIFSFVAIGAWVLFLPSNFWDSLINILTPKDNHIRIFYDGDCGFCKKFVDIIKTFLVINQPIEPAQKFPEIYKELQSHNSWIVEDSYQRKLYKFDAFIKLCRVSPIFRFIAPILNLRPIKYIGDLIYTFVSNNRPLMGRSTEFLTYRPISLNTNPIVSAFVYIMFIYVLMWNIRAYNFNKFEPYFPRELNVVAETIRTDQKWDMFAPYPLKDDGWYVIPGKFSDGSEIDLFSKNDNVTWEKPKYVSETYQNQRWRKYMMNIWKKKNSDHRSSYANYLCNEWNKDMSSTITLDSFDIIFMREDTLPNYEVPTPKEIKLYSHKCSI